MRENRPLTREETKKRLKRLAVLRNALLVLAFVLILIPSAVTGGWTPRIACLPLIACVPLVKYMGRLEKELPAEDEK